jgi:hypothetical protein
MARTTYTTPLLVGMLALTACPGDDVPADTEGTSTGEATDDLTSVGPTTAPPTTTVDPDSTSTTTTTDPDTSSSGGEVCEPVCEAGECCVGGFCFDQPEPTCEGGCGDFETCACPEGSDPCDCVGECTVCGTDGTYDSCIDAMCPAGSVCVVDDPDAPTFAFCAEQGCGTDDCACPLPAGDATAAPGCGVFAGDDGTGSCFLDCSANDATCPTDMVCRTVEGESACVWPGDDIISSCCTNNPGTTGCDDATCEATVCAADSYCCDTEWDQICADAVPDLCPGLCPLPPSPGYGNCGLTTVECAMVETCLDDGMPSPAWAVCSQGGCAIPADCESIEPATGDALVTCADPGGAGANMCYLDCSGGETCPDGMACTNDSLCAWTQGPVVFADDFETGDLSMGWTLNDVDGLTPDAMVNFVTEAWVVSDIIDGVNNQAVSTSWYAPAGMSDDWLISPQIMLGANTRLYWVSSTANAGFPDSLEVRISTATTAIMDFEANPALLIADPEQDVPVFHFVDLAPAGYMNQQVYIAFRNLTFDGVLLTVDDVAVVDLP